MITEVYWAGVTNTHRFNYNYSNKAKNTSTFIIIKFAVEPQLNIDNQECIFRYIQKHMPLIYAIDLRKKAAPVCLIVRMIIKSTLATVCILMFPMAIFVWFWVQIPILQSPSTEQTPDSSGEQLAERKTASQANDFVIASERVREVG